MVHLRPLSISEDQSITLAASGPIDLMARRIAASMVEQATPAELLSSLLPAGLSCLHEHWQVVQETAWAPVGALTEWLRRSVNDVAEVTVDGAAAWTTESPSEYYGRPVHLLTQAQLTWYLGLRDAYDEFFVAQVDSKGKSRAPKKPTKRWLDVDREARKQWQMNG